MTLRTHVQTSVENVCFSDMWRHRRFSFKFFVFFLFPPHRINQGYIYTRNKMLEACMMHIQNAISWYIFLSTITIKTRHLYRVMLCRFDPIQRCKWAWCNIHQGPFQRLVDTGGQHTRVRVTPPPPRGGGLQPSQIYLQNEHHNLCANRQFQFTGKTPRKNLIEGQ